MNDDTDDRFGFTLDDIKAAMEEHRGMIRLGCYIPTREEVANSEPAMVCSALHDWWWESPTRLIPSDEQIDAVIEVLLQRADADHPDIQRLIVDRP